jgi:hypothetical protein
VFVLQTRSSTASISPSKGGTRFSSGKSGRTSKEQRSFEIAILDRLLSIVNSSPSGGCNFNPLGAGHPRLPAKPNLPPAPARTRANARAIALSIVTTTPQTRWPITGSQLTARPSPTQPSHSRVHASGRIARLTLYRSPKHSVVGRRRRSPLPLSGDERQACERCVAAGVHVDAVEVTTLAKI